MAPRYRIGCINKTNRHSAHERIHSVGGVLDNGQRWRREQQDIVSLIDNGQAEFYVLAAGKQVEVKTAVGYSGVRYIQTEPDNVIGNNLLNLPECP